MSDAIWPAACASLLSWEGGYVDDPDDPGGATNFGISQRSYPDLDIRALTREEAARIYRRDWWERYALADLPDAIGAKLLDAGTDMGMHWAVLSLQRVLAVWQPGIELDGLLGPETRDATYSVAAPLPLRSRLCVEIARYYRQLAEEHPRLRRYLNGWLKRAAAPGVLPADAAG